MQISDQIEREVVIDAPVERVWALLTESEHVGTWLAGAGADIDLRPGGAMTMGWKQYCSVLGRVERVDPPEVAAERAAGGREPSLS